MAVGTAAALATAASTAYAAKASSDASKRATRAIESGKVDPDKVSRLTREEAIRNLRESIDIEAQVTPENQQLRRGSVSALLPLLQDQGTTGTIEDIDATIQGGGAGESELLTESIAEARRQLGLGGALDSETRNEVTRRAIARGGNTQLARFSTPRDLGLTSLQLQQQRLQTGGQFGQIEQNRMQTAFENIQRLRQLREELSGMRQQRAVQLAGFGQTLSPPDIGLNPGEYAGLYVQNSNIGANAALTRAQLDAQNAQNLARTVSAGVGALTPIFANTKASTPSATPNIDTTGFS